MPLSDFSTETDVTGVREQNVKLNALFEELQIAETNRTKICAAFCDYLYKTSKKEINLETIINCVYDLAAVSTNDDKTKQLLQKIAHHVNQHADIFQSNVKRLEEAENKITLMKQDIIQMKEQTTLMNQEIIQMKEDKNLKDSLVLSNEISSIYIERIVKPVLLRKLGNATWDNFCNKLSIIEQQLDTERLQALQDDKQISDEVLYEPLIRFLQPIQNHIKISLTDIRFLRNDRASLVHSRTKTTQEQLALMEKAKKFPFSEQFEFKQLVQDMIVDLEQNKSSLHQSN